MQEKRRRTAIFGWTMYDWANSAFGTTIMAAVLPVYYGRVAAANLPPNLATAYWGYTNAAALFVIAALSPILGALADFTGSKKRFLTIFVLLGVTGSALLFFVQTGDWVMASLYFMLGNLGFSGSLVFYDALLPHIAAPDELDQVSARGYAMGYIGGGTLLAINLAMIQLAPASQTALMTRLSFLSVAVWWFVFTLPLWRYVSEPPRQIRTDEAGVAPLRASLRRLGRTFREIGKYRQLSKTILAFWLYSNGIGTIIVMAGIYGAELNFGETTIIGTLLMVQFAAIPFALLFGRLGRRYGTIRMILISLVIFVLVTIGGYFMRAELHFWLLGLGLSTVLGGSQALSRALVGRMVPKSMSAEFFSFFSISEKIAGTVGPLIFGLVTQLTGGGRLGVISLIVFFVLGGLVLMQVDEAEGARVAQEVDRQTAPAST
ncbi:MAG: MFS transporter [Anaerolineales bacterium]